MAHRRRRNFTPPPPVALVQGEPLRSNAKYGREMDLFRLQQSAAERASRCSATRTERFEVLLNCFLELRQSAVPSVLASAIFQRNDERANEHFDRLMGVMRGFLSIDDDGTNITGGFEAILEGSPLLAAEFKVVRARGATKTTCPVRLPVDDAGKVLPIRAADLLKLALCVGPKKSKKRAAKPQGSLLAIQSDNQRPFAIVSDGSRDAHIRLGDKSWGIHSFIVKHDKGFRAVMKRGDSWFALDNPNHQSRKLSTKSQLESIFSSVVMVFAGVISDATGALVPVPSVVLSDALLFADPSEVILFRLATCSDSWAEALALATPYWDVKNGKLNKPVNFSMKFPPLVAKSITFDPERDVKIGRFEPMSKVNASQRNLFAMLQRVRTYAFPMVEDLSKFLTWVPNLTALTVGKCETLESARPFSSLPSLHTLHLQDCSKLADLSAIVWMGSLKELLLSRCPRIKHFNGLHRNPTADGPTPPLALEKLIVKGCKRLRDLSGLTTLAHSLKELILNDCFCVEDLIPLESVPSLQLLDVSSCDSVVRIPDLKALTSLKSVNLASCTFLTDISGLGSVTSLVELDLDRCMELRDVSALQSAVSLEKLSVRGCFPLDVSAFGATSLQTLLLGNCKYFLDLSGVAQLTSMRKLMFTNCTHLTTLTGLESFEMLTEFKLTGCTSLTHITGLGRPKALRTLCFENAVNLVDISGLATLQTLQSLEISNCTRLTDVSALASLTGLTELSIKGSQVLYDLTPLVTLTSLQYLSLNSNWALYDLSCLTMLTSLRTLELIGCQGLLGLNFMEPMLSLKELHVSMCPRLRDLSGLCMLPSLQILHLRSCWELEDLSPIASLLLLEDLDISECGRIQCVAPLASLPNLQKIHLRGADQIKDVQFMASLPSLRELTWYDLSKRMPFARYSAAHN